MRLKVGYGWQSGRIGRGWYQGRVRCERILFKVSQILATGAMVCVVLILGATFIKVGGLYIPQIGYLFTGVVELSELIMGMISVLGGAYCWHAGAHLRIRLLIERCNPKNRAILEVIASFLFLIWVAIIAWGAWRLFMQDLDLGVTSRALEIPVAPFVLVFGFALAHLTLVVLMSGLGFVDKARGHHVEHEGFY